MSDAMGYVVAFCLAAAGGVLLAVGCDGNDLAKLLGVCCVYLSGRTMGTLS